MKKMLMIILICIFSIGCIGCDKEEDMYEIEPDESQMRSICELATLEYHFHNVAIHDQKKVKEFLFKSWNKTFWVEYSGIIKAGIKVNKLKIKNRKNKIIIYLPKAEILSCDVDDDSIKDETIYVDDDSVKIGFDDANSVVAKAQENMKKKFNKDEKLLQKAQSRAKVLLEEYIKNLGEEFGIKYTIEWKIEE